MFLHIGAEKEVLTKNVIGILNISTAVRSKITKEFIKMAEEEEFTVKLSNDEAKSIVVVSEDNNYMLYFSPINSVTLQNRLNSLQNSYTWRK